MSSRLWRYPRALYHLFPLLILALTSVYATPVPVPTPLQSDEAQPNNNASMSTMEDSSAGFRTLNESEISAFRPYSFYASAGYCGPRETATWTCGVTCDANPTFIPTASGGNGILTQYWYVGYDPTLKMVIVSHQGTDPAKLLPLLTDITILPAPLDPVLFPLPPPSSNSSQILVHLGFAQQHTLSALEILSAVEQTLATHAHECNKVTVVGHSLGAALALLDGVFLSLHLKRWAWEVGVDVIGYGLPRVGNEAFADYVDANVNLTRVNNRRDFVPILPGRFLGFHHPRGEIHIQDSGEWITCPGQDNADPRCAVGDVKNVLRGKLQNHNGPYDGVTMGCPTA